MAAISVRFATRFFRELLNSLSSLDQKPKLCNFIHSVGKHFYTSLTLKVPCRSEILTLGENKDISWKLQ